MEINGSEHGNKACVGELGEGGWNNYSPSLLAPNEEQISGTNQMVTGQFIPYVPDKISLPTTMVPYQSGCQYSLIYPGLINKSLVANDGPNGYQYTCQTPYNNHRFNTKFSQNYNTGVFETKNPSPSLLMQPSKIFMNTRNNHYIEPGFMSSSRFLSAGIPSFSYSVNFPAVKPNDIFQPIHTRNLEKVVRNSQSASCKEGQQIFPQSQNLADISYTYFSFPEHERLRCGELESILTKELTKSDVGSIGRIVLPKKYAEANLPSLYQSDGIHICMDDMTLSVTWKFKYRFWPNNKSRMYILENAGDFVKSHGLQAGDILSIHKSTVSANYFIKGEKKIEATTTA